MIPQDCEVRLCYTWDCDKEVYCTLPWADKILPPRSWVNRYPDRPFCEKHYTSPSEFAQYDHDTCKLLAWQDQIEFGLIECAEFTLMPTNWREVPRAWRGEASRFFGKTDY